MKVRRVDVIHTCAQSYFASTVRLAVFQMKLLYAVAYVAQGRLPIRGLFLGARGARALPERPAAQGAATGLCLFQSAVRISPAFFDAGSIAHLAHRLRNNSSKIVANHLPQGFHLRQGCGGYVGGQDVEVLPISVLPITNGD